MKPETCFWDAQTAKMVGDRISKIRAFLRKKLILPTDNPGIYEVQPDPTGGRHTTYYVDTNLWTCKCQKNRDGEECSHIFAVRLFLHQVSAGGRDLYEGIKRQKEEKEATHFGVK